MELYQGNYWYFVTLVVQDRHSIFGKTTEGQLEVNDLGKIIEKTWLDLPFLFANLVLDEFVVMPNHFHGILGFNGLPYSKISNKSTNLSKAIKYFKAVSTIKIKSFVEENLDSPESPANTLPLEISHAFGEQELASTRKMVFGMCRGDLPVSRITGKYVIPGNSQYPWRAGARLYEGSGVHIGW